MVKVAALYIDPRGPYPTLLGPEMCWDEARDARTYSGPWPVVAHPPCGPWGRLRHLSRHDKPEHGILAVAFVRRFGGVLEHPAYSLLFEACRMPKPGEFADEHGGCSFEISSMRLGAPSAQTVVDLRCIYGIAKGGLHIELELKTATGKLTHDQLVWQAFCARWGVPHLVLQARSEESVEETVGRWCEEMRALL